MTSLAVAQVEATSEKPAGRNVVKREREWSGGVVDIRVPTYCRKGHFGEGDDRINFIKFGININGGIVNVFIHGGDRNRHAGRNIKALAEVHRKAFEGGGEYLHVDLTPIDMNEPATHVLLVREVADHQEYPWKEYARFLTPEPIRGEIILAVNPDFKPKQKEGKKKPAAKADEQKPPEDKRLAQLLRDGWNVVSDDGNKVELTRVDKQKVTKTLTYHRQPCKKKKWEKI